MLSKLVKGLRNLCWLIMIFSTGLKGASLLDHLFINYSYLMKIFMAAMPTDFQMGWKCSLLMWKPLWKMRRFSNFSLLIVFWTFFYIFHHRQFAWISITLRRRSFLKNCLQPSRLKRSVGTKTQAYFPGLGLTDEYYSRATLSWNRSNTVNTSRI